MQGIAALLGVLGLVVVGCDQASIQEACEHMASCQVPDYDTVGKCRARLQTANMGRDCRNTMAGDDCADLVAESWVGACLDRCSGDEAGRCLSDYWVWECVAYSDGQYWTPVWCGKCDPAEEYSYSKCVETRGGGQCECP